MALIKLTAIVDNISGKLNGTVFARNKGGHYMRSKSNPTNPRTTPQSIVRGVLGSISSKWRALTQGQRDAWDGAAPDFPYQNRMGDTKILSGFSLFMKLNQNIFNAGAGITALVNPPAPVEVSQPIFVGGSFGVNAAGTAVSLAEIDLEFVQSGEPARAILFVTPPMSAGIKNFSNRLRKLDNAVIPSSGGTTSFDIGSDYQDKFGVPQEGAKIGYAVRIVSTVTGQASPLVTGEVIVYAAD